MEKVRKRFEAKVKKLDSGCWEWTHTVSGGYGHFYLNGKVEKAHRAAYIIYKGPIPEGLYVLHECDNSKCVNPQHLEAGTQSKNMKDMYARQRREAVSMSKAEGLGLTHVLHCPHCKTAPDVFAHEGSRVNVYCTNDPCQEAGLYASADALDTAIALWNLRVNAQGA